MKPMQSARIASYPCRIERGTPNWTVSFRDVPQALAAGRGVPGIFEVAESALVAALGTLERQMPRTACRRRASRPPGK